MRAGLVLAVFGILLLTVLSQTTFVDAAKSSGTFLPETNSKKICGLSLCSAPLSIEEKINQFMVENYQHEKETFPQESLQVGGTGTLFPQGGFQVGGTGSIFPQNLPSQTTSKYCNGMTIEELIKSGNYNVIDKRTASSPQEVDGTPNPDLYLASNYGDTFWGREGSDCIIGGNGNDTLRGNQQNDSIFGLGGNDLISGQANDDYLVGGSGDDEIRGAGGVDTCIIDSFDSIPPYLCEEIFDESEISSEAEPAQEPETTPDDFDSDGVPNEYDECPDQAGPEENKGCPIPEPEEPTVSDDMDNDGIPNEHDECPDQAGPEENKGCPIPEPEPTVSDDMDNDGLPNEDDECPEQVGPKDNKGCPIPESPLMSDTTKFCHDMTVKELIESGKYNVIDNSQKTSGQNKEGTDGPDLYLASNHGDRFEGNRGDDCIIGGAGRDELDGNDGNDFIDGRLGSDFIDGGDGEDICIYDERDDSRRSCEWRSTDPTSKYDRTQCSNEKLEPYYQTWMGVKIEDGDAKDRGRYQHFENNASIFCTREGIITSVSGDIRTKYKENGWENGFLSYPRSQEIIATDGVGKLQEFKEIWIYSHPNVGTHYISERVKILLETEGIDLGYPISDGFDSDGRVLKYANFEEGVVCENSIILPGMIGPDDCNYLVYCPDDIMNSQYQNWMGNKIADGKAQGNGRYQHFENNASIFCEKFRQTVMVHGDIRTKYETLGFEKGILGYPKENGVYPASSNNGDSNITSCPPPYPNNSGGIILETYCPENGIQQFRYGTMYWNSELPGAKANEVHGQIKSSYESLGAQNGILGWPISDESDIIGLDGGRYSNFEGGIICWTGKSGSVVVEGNVGPEVCSTAIAEKLASIAEPLTSDSQEASSPFNFNQAKYTQFDTIYGSLNLSCANADSDLVEELELFLRVTANGQTASFVPDSPPIFAVETSTNSGIFNIEIDLEQHLRSDYQNPVVLSFQTIDLPYPPCRAIDRPEPESFAIPIEMIEDYADNYACSYDEMKSKTGSSFGNKIDDTRYPDESRIQQFENSASVYCNREMGAVNVYGEIWAKYRDNNFHQGFLGWPTTGTKFASTERVGMFNDFSGGSIYWHPDTGAHIVHGDIKKKWVSKGKVNSELGYPKTDERPTEDGVGRYQEFQGGTIHWHPDTGAFAVDGRIVDKWSSLNWENGFLGYPLTDSTPTPDGAGLWQEFQGGSIHWSPESGAHETHGAIRDFWAGLDWEQGFHGYPITDELVAPDGVGKYQNFQIGSIYWDPKFGVTNFPFPFETILDGLSISLDKTQYAIDEFSQITISNPWANSRDAGIDTVKVYFWGDDFDLKSFELQETGPNTGVFSSSFPVCFPRLEFTERIGNEMPGERVDLSSDKEMWFGIGVGDTKFPIEKQKIKITNPYPTSIQQDGKLILWNNIENKFVREQQKDSVNDIGAINIAHRGKLPTEIQISGCGTEWKHFETRINPLSLIIGDGIDATFVEFPAYMFNELEKPGYITAKSSEGQILIPIIVEKFPGSAISEGNNKKLTIKSERNPIPVWDTFTVDIKDPHLDAPWYEEGFLTLSKMGLEIGLKVALPGYCEMQTLSKSAKVIGLYEGPTGITDLGDFELEKGTIQAWIYTTHFKQPQPVILSKTSDGNYESAEIRTSDVTNVIGDRIRVFYNDQLRSSIAVFDLEPPEEEIKKNHDGFVELYGNWCGPGHPKNINDQAPPIDPVDAVCKVHDLCYNEKGYFDCECDRELVTNMASAIANPDTPNKGKAFGTSAMLFFGGSTFFCVENIEDLALEVAKTAFDLCW